jgi:virginiamycin B lyase
MKYRSLVLVACLIAVTVVTTAANELRAQMGSAVALTGRVSSAAEGPMEGVVISAKRAGSTVTVSVISDAQGRYRFPADRLVPGTYAFAIRAAGYDLAGPESAVVTTAGHATADVRLKPTTNLEAQLSSAELIAAAPGTYEQKQELLDCVDCHSIHRVLNSTHTADDFLKNVLPRMANYAFMSFPLHPQPFRSGRASGRPASAELAAYLASINLSSGKRTWKYITFPRLKGASTRVIITQYDLPRPMIEPHDVVTTPDGMVWYSDFGEQFLGMLDPKTAKVTEYPVPELKPGFLTGSLQLDADPAGNLWLAMMYQGGVAKFNRQTKTFTEYAVVPAAHPDFTQESMVMPAHDNVDGKVWSNNQDDHSFRRLHVADGTWDTLGPFTYPNSTEQFRSYGLVSDAQNNAWLFDFPGAAIAKIDAQTGAFKVIQTPTPRSRPRRGRVDDKTGLFWFAEYGANRIGMYDTRADNGTIKEFPLPTPWDAPYDVVADKTGKVWAGSMLTDRVSRLDPSTGNVVEYQLPSETNIRRVWVDDSTTPVTFWTGSNHSAAILKLETLP